MASTKSAQCPRLCIAFIGRLTGPKGELARRMATEVFPHFPATDFTIAGGTSVPPWRAQAGANTRFTNGVNDVAALAREMHLVIASGRTAIEAMRAGVPVLAVGEASCIGFVSTETFHEAQRTNFGDCSAAGMRPDLAVVTEALARFHAGFRPDTANYPALLAPYSGAMVAAAIEEVYRDVRIKHRLGRRALPILCYHRVVAQAQTDSSSSIHVTSEVLARQLRQLRRRGMTTITFADLLADRPLPRRPIILTFDDGYRDNIEYLLPLLERYDARAVIFALGDRGLRTNVWDSDKGAPEIVLMNDDELRACARSGRIEIGSHGLTHRHLSKLGDTELAHELGASKNALEAVIGASVVSFAYPWGEWSAREREAVARAGYAFGVATDHGAPLVRDRFAAARRIVFSHTSTLGFYKKTSCWYPIYRHLLGRPA